MTLTGSPFGGEDFLAERGPGYKLRRHEPAQRTELETRVIGRRQQSNDGERDGPSSRATKAIFVLLLHLGCLKDRKWMEIDFRPFGTVYGFFA
jgi:hypothetical protein